MLRGINLAIKFVLELAAVAAFAAWGASAGSGASAVVLGVAAAAVAVASWGVFAAPKSPRRLPTRPRIAFELAFFALAVVALVALGLPFTAGVFGVSVLMNAALLSVFDDWSE